MTGAGSLRAKQRLSVMRRVQVAALDLFDRDGFDAVSIERIAERAETSPATVYRYFGAKDRIIIWDETDEDMGVTLLAAFAEVDFSTALIRFASFLDGVNGPARRTTLRRLALIKREPVIGAQAIVNAAEFGDQVANAIAGQHRRRKPDFDDILAGQVAAGILSTAILEWAQAGGRKPLADIVSLGLVSLRSTVESRPSGL